MFNLRSNNFGISRHNVSCPLYGYGSYRPSVGSTMTSTCHHISSCVRFPSLNLSAKFSPPGWGEIRVVLRVIITSISFADLRVWCSCDGVDGSKLQISFVPKGVVEFI